MVYKVYTSQRSMCACQGERTSRHLGHRRARSSPKDDTLKWDEHEHSTVKSCQICFSTFPPCPTPRPGVFPAFRMRPHATACAGSGTKHTWTTDTGDLPPVQGDAALGVLLTNPSNARGSKGRSKGRYRGRRDVGARGGGVGEKRAAAGCSPEDSHGTSWNLRMDLWTFGRRFSFNTEWFSGSMLNLPGCSGGGCQPHV